MAPSRTPHTSLLPPLLFCLPAAVPCMPAAHYSLQQQALNNVLGYVKDTAGGMQLSGEQQELYSFLLKDELLLQLVDALREQADTLGDKPRITSIHHLEDVLLDEDKAAVLAALKHLGTQCWSECDDKRQLDGPTPHSSPRAACQLLHVAGWA